MIPVTRPTTCHDALGVVHTNATDDRVARVAENESPTPAAPKDHHQGTGTLCLEHLRTEGDEGDEHAQEQHSQ